MRPKLRVDQREEYDGGRFVVFLVLALEDVALLYGLVVQQGLHLAADLGERHAVQAGPLLGKEQLLILRNEVLTVLT